MTAGIVSAVDRPVVAGDSRSRSYINAIQTDAAINPGNSGGPLIDMAGRVIGVNSAIATPPGSSSGVLLDESYSGPGAKVRDAASSEDPVTDGGPADRAGVRPGDVIVRFDGRTVEGSDDLIVAIRAKSVGDRVTMTVRRDGRTVDVTMTLQPAPKK